MLEDCLKSPQLNRETHALVMHVGQNSVAVSPYLGADHSIIRLSFLAFTLDHNHMISLLLILMSSRLFPFQCISKLFKYNRSLHSPKKVSHAASTSPPLVTQGSSSFCLVALWERMSLAYKGEKEKNLFYPKLPSPGVTYTQFLCNDTGKQEVHSQKSLPHHPMILFIFSALC